MSYVAFGDLTEFGLSGIKFPCFSLKSDTVMTLSFWTDGLGKQCRPRSDRSSRSSLIRVFTVCYSICIFLSKFPKVWPLCFNFR